MDDKLRRRIIVLLLAVVFVVGIIVDRPQMIKSYRFLRRNFSLGRITGTVEVPAEKQWYFGHKVIAHSCGAAPDGTAYTDCLEAIEASYESGIRLFDADITLTSDGIPVLKHEWTDAHTIYAQELPDYDSFMNTKIAGKYTPVDCHMMLEYMSTHDDAFFVCDVKKHALTEVYSYIVKEAEEMGQTDCLSRIIPSFYEMGDYAIIREVYDFGGYTIRQYTNKTNNYSKLIDFCIKNNIGVIMVDKAYINQGDNLRPVVDAGIEVWAAVVNDVSEYEALEEKGVTGIVSDELCDDDL